MIFEWITAATYPAFFNASHDNNNFDDRSDDKGPEPEGVVLGKCFGNTYAFICSSALAECLIYDISNPEAPEFVQYVNQSRLHQSRSILPHAGDLGPEGLLFIEGHDSPTMSRCS
jgi:hypothetical protein